MPLPSTLKDWVLAASPVGQGYQAIRGLMGTSGQPVHPIMKAITGYGAAEAAEDAYKQGLGQTTTNLGRALGLEPSLPPARQ
jgi:hypothetical protein